MKNYAYVDGSFNKNTKTYGFGAFIIDPFGNKWILQGFGNDPNLSKFRNVSGEILGTLEVLKKASNLEMKNIKIFYDYEGIRSWALGYWKCKNFLTKRYKKEFDNYVKKGLKITFEHIKSHSGNIENDEVDQIAKLAVGIGNLILNK